MFRRAESARRGAAEKNDSFAAGCSHPKHNGSLKYLSTTAGSPAKPIGRCAGRLEIGVDDFRRRTVAGVREPFRTIENARTRQRQPVDEIAAILHILLGGERAHTVPQQDERDARLLASGNPAEPHHIFYQQVKATWSEIAEGLLGKRSPSVSAVIVAVYNQPGCDKAFGRADIPPHVLAEAVSDLHDTGGASTAFPTHASDLHPVGAGESEGMRHDFRCVHRLPYCGTLRSGCWRIRTRLQGFRLSRSVN